VSGGRRARPAEAADAPAIIGAPRTPEPIAALLVSRANRYPAVAVKRDAGVVGFAWTGEYRPRQAYAGVAEVSIWMDCVIVERLLGSAAQD
jgi:L-amino acid N-acyltransferase YncA